MFQPVRVDARTHPAARSTVAASCAVRGDPIGYRRKMEGIAIESARCTNGASTRERQ